LLQRAHCASHGALNSEAYPSNGRPPSVVVLGSKGTIPITAKIDTKALKDAQEGKITLFFYGHVDYEDVFKHPHSTLFCFEYMPTLENGKLVGQALVMLPQHNDAD
jgi:hypothetical protein